MFTSINNSYDFDQTQTHFGLGHKAKGKTSPQIYLCARTWNMSLLLSLYLRWHWELKNIENGSKLVWTFMQAFTSWTACIFPRWNLYSVKANLARNCKNSCHLTFQKEKTQKDCLIKLNFKCLWKLRHHEFFHQQHKHCKFLDFDWLFTSTIFTLYFFLFSLFIGSFNPTKYASMPDRMITTFFHLSSQSI